MDCYCFLLILGIYKFKKACMIQIIFCYILAKLQPNCYTGKNKSVFEDKQLIWVKDGQWLYIILWPPEAARLVLLKAAWARPLQQGFRWLSLCMICIFNDGRYCTPLNKQLCLSLISPIKIDEVMQLHVTGGEGWRGQGETRWLLHTWVDESCPVI